MSLTIGIDIKAFKNSTTGVARYLRAILDCLQKLDTDNSYILFEPRALNYRVTNPKWKTVCIRWRLPGILWQQFMLPFALKKHGVDVLWAPEQICPLFFTGKTRCIATVHDLAFIHVPESLQWSTSLIMRNTFPHVISRSDTLFAISNFIKNDLLTTYPNRTKAKNIVSTYNGRPGWTLPDAYDCRARKDFLFYAGNPEPRKNLIGLVKALEILQKKGKSIPLHLAGPRGWKGERIGNYIERSPVKNQIRVLGYLSEEQLRTEYLTCAALVYPSFYEGFGLPILEALELDCIALTSRDTVMQEVGGACALYFDPGDPKDMAAKIESIFSPDFDRTRYLGKKEAVLEKYSWEKTAKIIMEEFRKKC